MAPLVSLEDQGNMLFRMFVGGTAITFGLGYFHVARSGRSRDSLLLFGAGLKYWAFAAALTAYVFYGLSLAMLLLFGTANLCFALLWGPARRWSHRTLWPAATSMPCG